MVAHLEDASHCSADLADKPFFATTTTVRTGRRGRPRIEIDPGLLAVAFELRGPSHHVHPRTIRRRVLEQGLAEPGEPVYVDYEQPDGSITRVYRSSSGAVSGISDEELDDIVLYWLWPLHDMVHRHQGLVRDELNVEFTMSLAWAVTVHKSQGLALPKTRLGKKESSCVSMPNKPVWSLTSLLRASRGFKFHMGGIWEHQFS